MALETSTPVAAVDADKVADAYDRWGKGVHPAGLNFGDCFAYALAKSQDCPLLFVGDYFAQTDVESALASKSPCLPFVPPNSELKHASL